MKKLMNKKGFTLMEMLIVVAIIVILVAISIPTFTSQLDNAKKATDDANLRGAKGIAEVADMTAGGWESIIGETYADDEEYTLYYDIEKGTFVLAAKYEGGAYGQSSDYKGDAIKVIIEDGSMKGEPEWDTAPAKKTS